MQCPLAGMEDGVGGTQDLNLVQNRQNDQVRNTVELVTAWLACMLMKCVHVCRVLKGTGSQSVVVCVSTYSGGLASARLFIG